MIFSVTHLGLLKCQLWRCPGYQAAHGGTRNGLLQTVPGPIRKGGTEAKRKGNTLRLHLLAYRFP